MGQYGAYKYLVPVVVNSCNQPVFVTTDIEHRYTCNIIRCRECYPQRVKICKSLARHQAKPGLQGIFGVWALRPEIHQNRLRNDVHVTIIYRYGILSSAFLTVFQPHSPNRGLLIGMRRFQRRDDGLNHIRLADHLHPNFFYSFYLPLRSQKWLTGCQRPELAYTCDMPGAAVIVSDPACACLEHCLFDWLQVGSGHVDDDAVAGAACLCQRPSTLRNQC